MTYPYSTFVEFAAYLQSQVREKSSPSGIILAIYVDSEKLHANSLTDPGPPFHDVNAFQNCYFTGHNHYMA